MDFDEVIQGRRSIRGYKPDLVPRALIEEVLALAMRAPSSMNTQPWNFTVLTGEPLDRIRAGNTERMVAGVPQSREFRTGRHLPGRIANGRSGSPSSCSRRWALRAMTLERGKTGCYADFANSTHRSA